MEHRHGCQSINKNNPHFLFSFNLTKLFTAFFFLSFPGCGGLVLTRRSQIHSVFTCRHRLQLACQDLWIYCLPAWNLSRLKRRFSQSPHKIPPFVTVPGGSGNIAFLFVMSLEPRNPSLTRHHPRAPCLRHAARGRVKSSTTRVSIRKVWTVNDHLHDEQVVLPHSTMEDVGRLREDHWSLH